MKRNSVLVVGIIIFIVIVGGGYAIFHTSPTSRSSANAAVQKNKTAVNSTIITTKTDPKLGQYLSAPGSKALYTYGGDTVGISNCAGACLSNWPPYLVSHSTTNLPQGVTTIKRTDSGQLQYAYNGKPLYYFSGDTPGNVSGNGVDNFNIATPVAAASPSKTTTPATQNPSSQTNTNSYPNPY